MVSKGAFAYQGGKEQMAKDKFQKVSKKKPKTLAQKGVSFQEEANKSSMLITEIEVTEDDIIDEFATRYERLTSIEDGYMISDKRKARILEKILCGGVLPDEMFPLKAGNKGEAAYYLAARDVQDVVIVWTEKMFDKMKREEAAREAAKEKEKQV